MIRYLGGGPDSGAPDNAIQVRLQDGASSYYVWSDATINDNNWHHVALSFGADGMALYVDGELQSTNGTNAYTGGINGNDEPIVLGANAWNSGTDTAFPLVQYLDGAMDEFALFGTQLAAEDIYNLYATGTVARDYTTDEDTSLVIGAAQGVLVNDTPSAVTSGAWLNYDAANDVDGVGNTTWADDTAQVGWDWTFAASATPVVPVTGYAGITNAYSFPVSGTGASLITPLTTFQGSGTSGVADTQDATFEMWFKPSDLSDLDVLFESGSATTGTSLILRNADGDGLFDDLSFSITTASVSASVTADLSSILGGAGAITSEFIQVVAVYDRDGSGTNDVLTLYVNGIAVGSNNTLTTLNDWSSANAAGLGRFNGTINASTAFGAGTYSPFEGQIALFRFYDNNALDAAEVASNFNAVAQLPLTVTEVNGVGADVGNPVLLASGALVTLNADGSYTYDPNGAFESLNTGDSTTDTFTYTAADALGVSDTATVTITITGITDGAGAPPALSDDAFQQDPSTAEKFISIEAENFDNLDGQVDNDWTLNGGAPAATSGASGGGWVWSNSDNADAYTGGTGPANAFANASRLDYQVEFQEAGDYYVWIRAYTPGGSGDDSLYLGLDGAVPTYFYNHFFDIQDAGANGVGIGLGTDWNWQQARLSADGVFVPVVISDPGVHTVSLFVREDNLYVDKLVFTKDATWAPNSGPPTGTGPAESAEATTTTGLVYTLGGAAEAVAPHILVSDADSPNLASATLQITGNYDNGFDVLTLPAPIGSITGSWNAATGTLTLSGSGTLAQYREALASVTFASSGSSTLTRTVTFTANDGALDSNLYTRDIDIQTAASPTGVTEIAIPKTTGVITIDGAASEGDWTTSTEYGVGNVLLDAGTAPADANDLSGTWRTLWDDTNLYVYVDVTDDILTNDSVNPWDDDSIEIYIDGDNSKTTSYDFANDIQYVFGWNDVAVVAPEGYNSPAGRTDQVVFSMVNTGTGYRLEAAIPWAEIFGTPTVPSAGDLVGIEVHVNDDDTGGARDHKIAWLNTTDISSIHPGAAGEGPASFANALLLDGPTIAPANVYFSVTSTASISEDLGETSTFTVTLSGDPLTGSTTASVDITASGSATSGTDYSNFVSAITTAAGAAAGVTFDGVDTLTFDSTFNGGTGTGAFSFTVTAIDDPTVEGTETIVATLTNPTVSFSQQVVAGSDDAEQNVSSGAMDLTSSDLELHDTGGSDGYVGMRFTGLNIPQGATITSARIQFVVDEIPSGTSNPLTVTFRGHDTDSAPTFTSTAGDISNRTLTTASVDWAIPAWPTIGASGSDQLSADLSAIVQEIIDRPGWSEGNALALLITAWSGAGQRIAESFDGTAAPVLIVQYTGGIVTASSTTNITEADAGATYSISGTVYEDVNGDSSLADAVGASGVTVRLFSDDGDNTPDAGDTFITSTVTDINGDYTFSGLSDLTTYWVVVDSRTITPSAGVGAANTAWAEQTYAVTGAVTSSGLLASDGALYGGRSATTSDNSTDAAASLASSDHVTRVAVSGSNVVDIDSAFSFNVVTNIRGDGADDDGGAARLQQGSLHQFIINANTIVGDNDMLFVPAIDPNVDGGDGLGGGNDYWRINFTSALAAITGAGTTIDGTAYGYTEGVVGITVRDDNAGTVGTGGTVGVDGLALSLIDRPELELSGGNAFTAPGLHITAGQVTIEDLAINGFGNTMDSNQIQVDSTVTAAAGQAVITGNLIGDPCRWHQRRHLGVRRDFHQWRRADHQQLHRVHREQRGDDELGLVGEPEPGDRQPHQQRDRVQPVHPWFHRRHGVRRSDECRDSGQLHP